MSAFPAPLAPTRRHVFSSIFARRSSNFITINPPSRKIPRKPNPTFSLLPSSSCRRPSSRPCATRFAAWRAPPSCRSLQRKPARPPAGTGPLAKGDKEQKRPSLPAQSDIEWGELLSSEPANATAVVLTGALAWAGSSLLQQLPLSPWCLSTLELGSSSCLADYLTAEASACFSSPQPRSCS